MTEPTVGRIVWYWPANSDGIPCDGKQPCAAVVSHVNEDGTVNLQVADMHGFPHSKTQATLIQPEDPRPARGFAEWPAKVEAKKGAKE